jgi:VWFA-related protein
VPCFISMLFLPLLVLAQDASTFRSDVTLVHVEVDVRVREAAVADLHKEDFRIIDGGMARTVIALGHEEVPLDVVLLLDMRPNMLRIVERLADATELALRELRPGDQVAVASFSNDCQTKALSDFTDDVKTIEQGIRSQLLEQRPDAGPYDCQIIKALGAASQYLQAKKEGNRRRAIIAISHDKGSGTSPGLVRNSIHDLWASDAVVVSLNVTSGLKVFYFGPAFRGTRFAADRTGGDRVDFDDAPEAIGDAIRRLRSRYSLYYALPPGEPGEEHKIRVELTPDAGKRHKDAVVRARTGYVVPFGSDDANRPSSTLVTEPP